MNATELAWLGYTRAEVVGRMRHHDLHTPQSLQRYIATFAEFKKCGVLNNVEFEYLRKDGSILPVSLNATAIWDAQGNFLRSRTSVYDISDRKQAEQEILKLNASLEQRARELQASNQELESFSYSVSHDLRAPLRAIDGFALMLEEDYVEPLDDEGKRLLAVIRDNSRKMGTLIDDLLALSRLGRQRMACQPVMMEPLVREVAQEALAAQQPTTAQIDIGPLPAVAGDRTLLRQVWMNLIANALKYSGRVAQPHIEISATREDSEVIYRIRDNGAGFDMQYAGKLFGVFQRLHRADEFHGTGVGLAIVRRLVERHGGRTWAEGKPNEGATFYFAMPAGEHE